MTEQILKLTIPIPPSINNDYMKPRTIMKQVGDKKIPMTIMYESTEAKKFKKDMVNLIKSEIKKQEFNKDENKFTIVEYIFFFPKTNMDTNNYYKTFIDSITESEKIWKDDNISMMKDKRIYYDSKNPRVEVKIYYAPFIGIFDNQDDLDNFIEHNCNQCKKGNKIGQKGGCTIYKNALESRIQDELEINFETRIKKCLKKK